MSVFLSPPHFFKTFFSGHFLLKSVFLRKNLKFVLKFKAFGDLLRNKKIKKLKKFTLFIVLPVFPGGLDIPIQNKKKCFL